ncbi:riboflavin kinase [Spiroplasma tabanidicola]|uniref:riboflavin kinase n=1 Tax=Spiroplasma tabanidicola TaxID=324079 RepID=A0A6I6C6W6_9MOLU|nr:riboflavin kinase [Spiroplasma tabanidicola]QGS51940.1 riboflavin kinase/FAD synthetase [Spiroplasma tabanidicola]
MTKVYYYNSLNKILLNLDDSICLFANFNNWYNYENLQIEQLKKYAKSYGLKTTLLLPINSESQNKIWNNKNIVKLAKNLKIDQLVFYYVNFVVNSFSEDDILNNFKNTLSIKKILITSDYQNAYWEILNRRFFEKKWEKNCIIFKSEQFKDDYKRIYKKLKESDFNGFKNLTGFDYEISGIISEGKKIGRTIGYPTINILIEDDLPLTYGVYGVETYFEQLDKTFLGAAMYWKNDLNQKVLEVYILDFDKDVYGWSVDIKLLEKIRNPIKITSLEDLKKIIKNDVDQIKKIWRR